MSVPDGPWNKIKPFDLRLLEVGDVVRLIADGSEGVIVGRTIREISPPMYQIKWPDGRVLAYFQYELDIVRSAVPEQEGGAA